MFDDHVKKAQRILEQATAANNRGDRETALKKLQEAQDALQFAGTSLDGVAPKETPFLPNHELWGWRRNEGRG